MHLPLQTTCTLTVVGRGARWRGLPSARRERPACKSADTQDRPPDDPNYDNLSDMGL